LILGAQTEQEFNYRGKWGWTVRDWRWRRGVFNVDKFVISDCAMIFRFTIDRSLEDIFFEGERRVIQRPDHRFLGVIINEPCINGRLARPGVTLRNRVAELCRGENI
jgi:hypothetical protein